MGFLGKRGARASFHEYMKRRWTTEGLAPTDLPNLVYRSNNGETVTVPDQELHKLGRCIYVCEAFAKMAPDLNAAGHLPGRLQCVVDLGIDPDDPRIHAGYEEARQEAAAKAEELGLGS